MATGIIKFIGLNKLEDSEQAMIKELAERHSLGIQREIKDITDIVLQIQTERGGDKRPKYAITLRADTTKGVISSEKSSDWDLNKAIAEAFKKLEKEISHKFHNDTSLGKIRK
jgi:hypothetical protein